MRKMNSLLFEQHETTNQQKPPGFCDFTTAVKAVCTITDNKIGFPFKIIQV